MDKKNSIVFVGTAHADPEDPKALFVEFEKDNKFLVFHKDDPTNILRFSVEGVICYLKYLYFTQTYPFQTNFGGSISPRDSWHMSIEINGQFFPPFVGKGISLGDNMPERQAGRIILFGEIVTNAVQILKDLNTLPLSKKIDGDEYPKEENFKEKTPLEADDWDSL